MKGSIRFVLGFLVVMGAVGTLDIDPQAGVAFQGMIALGGLLLMASGVTSMRRA